MALVSSGNWTPDRRLVGRLSVPRILPRKLRSLHTLALVAVLVMVGWLGWMWYRSSSFVKVHHVTVAGLTGPDVPQITDALTQAALGMTTLHIEISKLEAAVEPYSYVRSLTVEREGAHAVRIDVVERVPVALTKINGQDRVLDAAGDVLPTTTVVHATLPQISLTSAPAGTTITQPGARAAIAVLGAAPYALLSHIVSAAPSSAHGVILQVRNGPQIYFGLSTQLRRKWDAAVAVLQNSQSAGAAYIDVSDPSRPAAGADVTATQAAALGLTSGG